MVPLLLSFLLKFEERNESLSDSLVYNLGKKLLDLLEGELDLRLGGVLAESLDGLLKDRIGGLHNLVNSLQDVVVDLVLGRLLNTINLDDVSNGLLEIPDNDVLDSLLDLEDQLLDSFLAGIFTGKLDSLAEGLVDGLDDVVLSLLNVRLDLLGIDLYNMLSLLVRLGKRRSLMGMDMLVRALQEVVLLEGITFGSDAENLLL